MLHDFPPGSYQLDNGKTRFTVWSPNAETVDLHLLRQERYIPMIKDEQGYFRCTVSDVRPGDRYLYRLNGDKERPDPASRSQPDDIHGASEVVDSAFAWQDENWLPPTLRNSVIYELHVGTFTPEGTFEAIIPHLERLKNVGITTLELMPVAQFPGTRNWGYDGVQIYAAHSAYGGARGLKTLVNACHQQGMAVLLDVVYNHLGPEGNYLWDYGPYFTDRYKSPWGECMNLDGDYSDPVREFFIHNALYWLFDCHIDGLRMDATHALFDFSANPFMEVLVDRVRNQADKTNRRVYLIAENDRSDRKLLLPREIGGTGLDGLWLDELHHLLHNALTGETAGYYMDFADFALLPKVLKEGFAYSGQYSPLRKRRHGTPSGDIPANRFIVHVQNHDHVGNRMKGERLTQLTDFEGLKLAAGLLLTSPYVPMLFMGEEYGETAPFLYFISHGDSGLIEAVRKGRKTEFAYFAAQGEPPDPQSEDTFNRSKLNHDLRHTGNHALLYRFYGALLKLRHTRPELTNPRREDTHVEADIEKRIIILERHEGTSALRIIFNFHLEQPYDLPQDESWQPIFDSANWPENNPQKHSLSPKSFVIYEKKDAHE